MNFNIYKLSIWMGTLLLVFLSVGKVSAGSIKGRVIDSNTHESIVGANITVENHENHFAVSDGDGKYIVDHLPAGKYVIHAKSIGYDNSYTQEIIITSENQSVTFDIYLKPESVKIDEVQVTRNVSKESDASARTSEHIASNVVNIISAKAIEQLPDLNVADVMGRISGVSMMKSSSGSNSRLIIRGMPSRYNCTMLNGIIMPKSISLDMFGIELVGRIEVAKSLTPDLEADAIGGTVNIIMKQAPEASFCNVQFSTGYNQYYFDHKFLTFDNTAVSLKDFNELKGPNYVPVNSDFQRKNLVIKSIVAPPNLNGSISVGRRFFNDKLGVIVSGNAQKIYSANTNENNSYDPDPQNVTNPNNLKISLWEHQTYCKEQQRYGTFVKLDYQFNNNNQINFYNAFFQLNDLRARNVIDTLAENGRTGPGTGTVRPIRTQTITDNTGIENAVLAGNHKLLKNLEADWTIAYSYANSQSPDYATVDLSQQIPQPTYLNYASGIVRIWQWDIEETKSFNFNIKYSPTIFNHIFELKAGGLGRVKFRKNYANEYDFDAASDNNLYPNPNILTVPLKPASNDQQAKGDAINNPGNYRAWEDDQAIYGMVKTNFGKLEVLAGIRVEFTYMKNEHNQNDPQMPVAHARFSYYDPLASIHLNYKFTDNQNFRISMYQALNRPYFTEVIPYSDPRPGGETGNDTLHHTLANCFDLRYEIYPSHEDVFSVGMFYKNLTNPIEELVQAGSDSKGFKNVSQCTNFGFELVGMKYFGNFGITANYTYTNSKIVVPKNFNVRDTVNMIVNTIPRMETRPLVGQSPHLINIGLSYRDTKNGFKCNLAYTMQGAHVVNVNSAYGQDWYQRNYHNLGATIEKNIYKKLVISAKVSNLLRLPIEWYTKNGFFIERINTYQNYFIGLKLSI